ncbi:MAG: hypothetical protein IPG05_15970 [Gemmatimonadetes bacterium]|nr:hypothetical protein [Gemmatimonadota bacterium]
MSQPVRYLLLTLGIVGCSDGGGAGRVGAVSRDSGDIRIVENAFDSGTGRITVDTTPAFRIGSGADAEAPLFGHVTAVHVLASGTIAILDLTAPNLLFVDTTGTVLGRAGGKGSGPGEFPGSQGGMVQTFAGLGDSIYAVINRADVAVFVPGRFVRAFKLTALPDGGFPMTVAVVGSSLVASKRLPQSQRAPGMYRDSVTLQRYALDGTLGEALDGVPNVETRQHPMGSYPAPFGKRLQVASKQGWMVTGFPEHFEIASRNPEGRVARIVRLSKPDVPMTAAVVDGHKARLFDNFGGSPEERSAMEADLSLDQLPKTLPAYSAVKVDGMGRVWVREYIELDGMGPMNADMGKGPRWRPDVPARWYVFSNDGEFLGTVRLPLGFVVHDIGKDHIVGVIRDADDVEYVVGYPFREKR